MLTGNKNIQFVLTKNGRTMMKSICDISPRVKTRFVKSQSGQSIGDILDLISTTLFPQTKQMSKDYESGKIAKEVVNKRDGIQTKRFWKPSKKKTLADRFLKGQCTRTFKMSDGRYMKVGCD